jgi:uncharacterized membrane protein
MDNTRLPNSIFFMLCVLAAVQFAYYSPRLPEVLASHFATSGRVNGWQTKAAFFSMDLTFIVLATVISFGVPRLIAAMPVSLINLPNKQIWLGPERRDSTLFYIRTWSGWFGCALLAFLLYVMELAFRANLQTPPHFNNAAFLPALFAFIVFDTFAVLRLIFYFSKPSQD